jgi:hypothetical protein
MMAAEHERWIVEMLADVPADERNSLYHLLGVLKAGLARTTARAGSRDG